MSVTDKDINKDLKRLAETTQLTRTVLTYLEKFDRYDCQELLSHVSCQWLLSNEEFRLPTDPPAGLISTVSLPQSNSLVLLIPDDPRLPPFDYRELHTIVRELTVGIYVLHDTPLITLEANYDQSTSCQLPPAYMDTHTGQSLITVDYFMKCLWHGAFIPKDKRIKFSERWRSNLDVNQSGKPETRKPLINEFIVAGMHDITKDPDLADAYKNLPVEHHLDPKVAEEQRFFMEHVDALSMNLHFSLQSVKHHKHMFILDADYHVSTAVRLLDDSISLKGFERLKARLQLHEKMIHDNIEKKMEILKELALLKFISFMTPYLVAMKKRMKIPDVSRLLPAVGGEECRTERELPPLILGPDFKCKNFFFGDQYFHLHGGIGFDLETDQLTDASSEFKHMYKLICKDAMEYLNKILESETPGPESLRLPSYTINGKRYSAMLVEFETFYGSFPHKPMWVRAYHEEITKMKAKKLPMSDIHLHEQFKKFFGSKKAIKFKTPVAGLRAACWRGLVAMFQAICRKMPGGREGKPDEQGLCVMHHAAINNRLHILTMLLLQSMDVNVRRTTVLPTGPTSLHMAARCGALDAVSCLLANYADPLAVDKDGWAPIHHAAFFNHRPIIRLMVRKKPELLELLTKNEQKETPLLVAAMSGALSALKCLIHLDADIIASNAKGHNMVMLASRKFHTNILEFLIEWDSPAVPVWNMLVDMLRSENMIMQDSAVRCLEVLAACQPRHWKAILKAGAVPALVYLLKGDSYELQTVAASVLCSVSENKDIRVALTEADAVPILIKLLASPVEDIHSRAAILLSDLAQVEGNQEMIAGNAGIGALVKLLNSDLEDVLVNAANALRVICSNNPANQTAAVARGVISPLVEFLTVVSDDLQAGAAAAIAAMCRSNKENQDAVMMEGAAKPLVDLIRTSRSTTVQVKAASALHALAENNLQSQHVFLRLDAPKAVIRLLKNIYTEVREQGALALWALAGDGITQQRNIAECVSIPLIIQMLLEPTDVLLHVGCKMAIALGYENMENQNKLAQADAFQQLVRLLRTKRRSSSILLMVIKVVGILCIGVAYRNNKVTQRRIADEGGILVLVQILLNPCSEEIPVEVAISLACLVLSNRQNQEKLQEEPRFKFDLILDLLRSKNEDIRLRAGMALSLFAFNNTPQQFAIREAGGFKFSIFESFLISNDEFFQCYSAFQIVVLARVIVDQDQVSLTAHGIKLLVDKLQSNNDLVLVLASSLLSSLAHTRAGIPDAIVSSDAIPLLVSHLSSSNDQVRRGAAITLGYLSFNKIAARIMFSLCRNTPGLFEKLMENIGVDSRICPDFVREFERAKVVGLPAECLEINGGPSVCDRIGSDGRNLSLCHWLARLCTWTCTYLYTHLI